MYRRFDNMGVSCWIPLLMQITLIAAASIPSCKLSDSQCLMNAALTVMPTVIGGIPELGAESLDPLHLDKVKVDLAGLKLTVKDADVKGLKKATIDKIKIDMNKKVMQIAYHTDVQMKGKYKASGKLLILPISGDGDMLFKLKNMAAELTIPFDFEKNAEGKYVMNLKSFVLKYDVKGGANYALTNLFNGNKELSDSMLAFMNSNWKILTQEFGPPILDAAHKKIFDSLQKYMALQPIDDVTP